MDTLREHAAHDEVADGLSCEMYCVEYEAFRVKDKICRGMGLTYGDEDMCLDAPYRHLDSERVGIVADKVVIRDVGSECDVERVERE